MQCFNFNISTFVSFGNYSKLCYIGFYNKVYKHPLQEFWIFQCMRTVILAQKTRKNRV